ncbi:AI-2E family transporter [Arthrobacter tecti]
MEYRSDTKAAPNSPWKDGLGRASIRSAQILLLITVLVVSIFGLIQIRLVVIPLLLALILAAAISPLVNMLRRRGWPSALATAFSFLLLLVVLGGVITGIVFAVRSQLDELTQRANEGFQQVYDFIQTGPIPIDAEQIESARQSLIDFVTSSTFGNTALTGLTAAGEFLTGLALMLVILFFFLKDGDSIWAFMLRAFRGERLARAQRVGHKSLEVLGGYVRGTAIIALVDSLFIGIALFVLGVPLALPLAVIVFIGSFVPLVGATVAGTLAALVALVANGPFVALMVIIVVVVVNQLEGNFLQPVVMGRSLNIHALVILLALTAGTILAGIVGAILSVPLAAVTWAAIKAWNTEEPSADPDPEQDPAAEEPGAGNAAESDDVDRPSRSPSQEPQS